MQAQVIVPMCMQGCQSQTTFFPKAKMLNTVIWTLVVSWWFFQMSFFWNYATLVFFIENNFPGRVNKAKQHVILDEAGYLKVFKGLKRHCFSLHKWRPQKVFKGKLLSKFLNNLSSPQLVLMLLFCFCMWFYQRLSGKFPVLLL